MSCEGCSCNSSVQRSDKISKHHLSSHRGTHVLSIVWFANGLFATPPNNCPIFSMCLPLFPLLPPLELSLLADAQAGEEKNGKSDLRNLNIVYVFIFCQGLLLYELPWNQPCVRLPPSPEPHHPCHCPCPRDTTQGKLPGITCSRLLGFSFCLHRRGIRPMSCHSQHD